MGEYEEAITRAKKAVENEEEPYRSIAFKVILTKLLDSHEPRSPATREMLVTNKRSKQRSKESQTSNGIDRTEETLDKEITFDIPQELLPKIMKLEEREKIPVIWSYASRNSMTISEFLVAASKKGFNFSPSWHPSQGGNFTNRLLKQDGVFARDGKQSTAWKFMLTDVGLLKVQKTISELSNESKDTD